MPAWITSELRELVCVPIASSASRITTSRPAMASARATARPTRPAPITMHSTLSMLGLVEKVSLGKQGEEPEQRYRERHRPRGAVVGACEAGADQRTQAERQRAHQGRGRAGHLREGR